MRFDTHLCLVSAQATPNLTPVLDQAFRPRQVVLAVSRDMEERARWMSDIMKSHGIRVEHLTIPDPYDLHGCSDILLDWLSAHDGDEAALNVTGGTKLMAMAAQEAFRTAGRPVFYVSAESDEVVFLDPALRAEKFVLSPRLRLRDYLRSHGFTPIGQAKPDIPANLRDLADHLVSSVSRWSDALGKLNAIAEAAEKAKRLATCLTTEQADSRSLDEVLGEFEQSGMLRAYDGEVRFADEASRAFVKGGWLEFHAYRNVADLAPQLGITDFALNVQVLAPDGVTRNEIDCAFMHRNRLHLIECKAGNLAAAGNTDEARGTDALYKLESLGKLGGLRTREMLIDYRGLLKEADRKRAAQSGIKVVSAGQLRNLKTELTQWVSK